MKSNMENEMETELQSGFVCGLHEGCRNYGPFLCTSCVPVGDCGFGAHGSSYGGFNCSKSPLTFDCTAVGHSYYFQFRI